MRHRKSGRKLGRTRAHRRAMMSNLATSLFDKERITTTLPRAKELRSFAEKLITKAKKDSLHSRRMVARVVRDKDVLFKMFDKLSPRYADRPGGYTRIYRIGYRKGDSAEMAIIELVDRPEAAAVEASGGGRKLIEREQEEETPEQGAAEPAHGADEQEAPGDSGGDSNADDDDK